MPIELVTPSLIEPVTVDAMRKHLRLSETFTEDDEMIELAVSAARGLGEKKTHRPWRQGTYKLITDGFPGLDQPIELMPSLSAVESVSYVDPDGVKVLMAADAYEFDKSSLVGSIYPAFGNVWPETRGGRQTVVIQFQAGFEELPAPLTGWLKITATDFYQNPESVVHSGSPVALDFVDTLLEGFIVPVVA